MINTSAFNFNHEGENSGGSSAASESYSFNQAKYNIDYSESNTSGFQNNKAEITSDVDISTNHSVNMNDEYISSLDVNGNNKNITVVNVTVYDGFIKIQYDISTVTIRDLTIELSGSTLQDGGTGFIRANQTVTDLSFINCHFIGDVSTNAGAFIGSNNVDKFENIYFTNCSVNGTTIGQDAGGFVGSNNLYDCSATFLDCSVNVTNVSTSAGGFIGATDICNSNVYFTNCNFNGSIDGSGAGFIAHDSIQKESNVTFTNCMTTGAIGSHGAGFIAHDSIDNSSNITFTDCSLTGDIGSHGAGFIAHDSIENNSTATFSNCSSTGDIGSHGAGFIAHDSIENNSTITFSNCSSTGDIGSHGAGFIAHDSIENNSTITFSNCSSTGNIDSNGAGFIGNNDISGGSSVSFTNCTYTGDIGNSGAGFIVNSINNSTVDISDCSHIGDIVGTMAGGFLSESNKNGSTTTIYDSNTNTTAITQGSGAIIGPNSNNDSTLNITRSYTFSPIDASAGGIIGSDCTGTVNMNECFTTGAIRGHDAGGLIGANFDGSGLLSACYTVGEVFYASGGGIFGANPDTDISFNGVFMHGRYPDDHTSNGIADVSANITNISEIYSSNNNWNNATAKSILNASNVQDISTSYVGDIPFVDTDPGNDNAWDLKWSVEKGSANVFEGLTLEAREKLLIRKYDNNVYTEGAILLMDGANLNVKTTARGSSLTLGSQQGVHNYNNIKLQDGNTTIQGDLLEVKSTKVDILNNVGVGKVAHPDHTLDVNGEVNAFSYNAISDERVKCNIVSLQSDDSLKTIRNLEPVKYGYKDNSIKTCGFIAQQVEQHLPQAVHVHLGSLPNGEIVDDFRSVRHDCIWSVLTSAVQELDKQLQDARQEISALKEKTTCNECMCCCKKCCEKQCCIQNVECSCNK